MSLLTDAVAKITTVHNAAATFATAYLELEAYYVSGQAAAVAAITQNEVFNPANNSDETQRNEEVQRAQRNVIATGLALDTLREQTAAMLAQLGLVHLVGDRRTAILAHQRAAEADAYISSLTTRLERFIPA